MIRLNRPSLWGNWALNSVIEVGAIGYIDPNSGDFTYFDTLQTKPIVRSDENSLWSMMSTNVTKSGGSANIAGTYDPTTGTQVTVEATATWSFSDSGEFISKFQPAYKNLLQNRGNQIASQMEQIKNVAKDNGYMSGDNITQGFGVITEVIYAEAGMNVGAQTSGSSFSITGSVDGIAGMTDSDQAKASLKGSYFKDSSEGSFDTHIWPASANEVATTNVPIAFVMSSFGPNNMIIPVWVNFISEFTIQIDNQHGGTWVVDVTITGDTGGVVGKNLGGTKVSGGSSGTISNIPLDVTNLTATVSFETGPTLKQVWATPLTQIPTGEMQIDIYGLAGGHASIEPHIAPPNS